MIYKQLAIPGAYMLDVERKTDDRGFFARCLCNEDFAEHGISFSLSQASIAFSHRAGTLRGLHYQAKPYEEDKLVRCTRGAAYVVIADPRSSSSARGCWLSVELTASNHRSVLVPKGCVQGYQTLEDGSEIFYQMSAPYAPHTARGIRHDDPYFGIDWPLPPTAMSERDLTWPDFDPREYDLLLHGNR